MRFCIIEKDHEYCSEIRQTLIDLVGPDHKRNLFNCVTNKCITLNELQFIYHHFLCTSVLKINIPKLKLKGNSDLGY